jgi:hypothetical protein
MKGCRAALESLWGSAIEHNREKVREYQRRYYEHHRDEVNARAAARRDANPERVERVSSEWAGGNKDRRAEYVDVSHPLGSETSREVGRQCRCLLTFGCRETVYFE